MLLRALLAAALATLPLSAQATAPAEDVVARGKGGATLGRAELEATLLERHGYSENGRELLDLFLKSRLLDALAAQRGIRVTAEEVTRRWEDLDKRSRAAGAPQGIAAEIQKRNLTPAQFREYLRLALVQERLSRAAIGVPSNVEVSGDKQELWLQQEINARGLEILPPAPGTEGVLARCGDVTVSRAEFARFLAQRLGREDVRETAWHLLLLHAIEARMPDISPEARARAVEAEVERRRQKHELEFPTITLEQRLGATGRTLDGMRRDPSVAIAALSRLWVDRGAGPEGIRSTYEKERAYFEARYGEAVRAALLFRVAGRFVNHLVPRTFDEAERELEKMGERCERLEDFTELVERHSEEPNAKKNKGDLGWVTRGEERVPHELREALFHMLDAGQVPAGGRLVGPVRLDSGCALLWLSARRPSPSWDDMSEHVHEELRRRFLEELMPRDAVELVASGA